MKRRRRSRRRGIGLHLILHGRGSSLTLRTTASMVPFPIHRGISQRHFVVVIVFVVIIIVRRTVIIVVKIVPVVFVVVIIMLTSSTLRHTGQRQIGLATSPLLRRTGGGIGRVAGYGRGRGEIVTSRPGSMARMTTGIPIPADMKLRRTSRRRRRSRERRDERRGKTTVGVGIALGGGDGDSGRHSPTSPEGVKQDNYKGMYEVVVIIIVIYAEGQEIKRRTDSKTPWRAERLRIFPTEQQYYA